LIPKQEADALGMGLGVDCLVHIHSQALQV
jgi:hypothetical protein